jgi:subtilisin family serine protease
MEDAEMKEGIDPLIDLYFEDRTEPFGGRNPEVVIELQKGKNLKDLPEMAGLEVVDAGEESVSARASMEAQRELYANDVVAKVARVGRPRKVSVLVKLRESRWNKTMAGFEPGDLLGTILTGLATSEAVNALSADPDVIAVEASREGGLPECSSSMPFIHADLVQRPPLSEKGEGVLVALIDSGVDVLHAAFQDAAGKTRLVGIWDQTSTSGDTPAVATGKKATSGAVYTQTFGRYHSAADINGYILAGAVPSDLGRDYNLLAQPPEGHGTHVASIMAGSPFTSKGSPDPADDGKAFPGGVAPEAGILLVRPKLSSLPGDPVSLGYSVAHVAALAFIKETARALKMPVAVNVSLGMNAGAHDGTSLLEVAFDEFSSGGREPGYVIVKSAGNEQSHDGHAAVQVPDGFSDCIEWITSPSPRATDYLEFWFSSADDLAFELTEPGGGVAVVDRKTNAANLNLASGATVYLRLVRFHHDNGDARLIMLVRNNANVAINESGTWSLKITGAKVVLGGNVHGWVERVNSRPLQFTKGAVAEQTLSIPGTARTVICVGACDLSNPVILQPFSSNGPCRDLRPKPELVAPGHGILASSSNTSHGLVSMPGTSMAAPHVTGAAALLMARRKREKKAQLNAAQIRAALGQSTQGFSGKWDTGTGYGPLDIQGLMDLF